MNTDARKLRLLMSLRRSGVADAAVLGAIDRMVVADAVLYPLNQANVTPKISAPVKSRWRSCKSATFSS